MAAREIEAHEPIEVKTISCLIYGQPGSRKTSLAQTAADPTITLAFDPGIYRAYGRKKCVMFETWEDVIGYNLSSYQTPIVDTLGMCLSKLAQSIIADNPKNGNKLGGLSLPGYGVLKSRFAAWVDDLRAKGKSLVFIAQEGEEKNGDEVYHYPAIVGQNYNTMMDLCDMVGYMHFDGGKRVIDWTPSDRWMAKTPPCGFERLVLPDFSKEPGYLAGLMAEGMASMGRISAASAEIAARVEAWRKLTEAQPDLKTFNAALPELKALTNGAKAQAWHLCTTYATSQGWTFDPKAKTFAEKGDAAE